MKTRKLWTFTLVELLIVIATVAILSACAARAEVALEPGAYPDTQEYNPHLTVGENTYRQMTAVALMATEGQISIPTNVPLAASYSNTTFEVDAGSMTLGVGQTTTVGTYLRFDYNFNLHVGVAATGEFGAANALNAGGGMVFARKVFNDNAEGYAGLFGKYSWQYRSPAGGVEVGARWVPFNTAVPNLAVHAAFQALYGGGSGTSGKPSTGILGGASWRF